MYYCDHSFIYLSFCFNSISGCNSQSQDKVDQHTRIQFAFEGDTVKIDCTYQTAYSVILMCNYTTTSTNLYLFWYKQLPNRSPTFILNQYTTEPDFIKKYSATLNSTPRTFPLTIKNLHVSDSAVYYCALRPALYKNSNSFSPLMSSHIKPTIYNSHNLVSHVEAHLCAVTENVMKRKHNTSRITF
uniref:Ig-like domain-containing protein n=1 Tax=Cyprinus carpio TaxID=7962 RepID=A0A8C1LV20_CYPCA